MKQFEKKNTVNNLLGFGAKPMYAENTQEQQQASHCIQFINNTPGTQGVKQAYLENLPHLQLSGPTHYSEIIKFINDKPLDHNMYYKVCVIVTDGEPQDL